MSEGSLVEQVEILVASICPESDDPAACEDAVRTYWSEIGRIWLKIIQLIHSTVNCTVNLKSYCSVQIFVLFCLRMH